MKTWIEVEFGKDSCDRGMEALNLWHESYKPTEEEEEFYGKNVFIQILGQIVYLPLKGFDGSGVVYSDLLKTLEYDQDNNIFQMFTYVEKNQDDYTGMFHYRKQGPTKAVPAYYVLIRFNFTEEVDVTKRAKMSMMENKKDF